MSDDKPPSSAGRGVTGWINKIRRAFVAKPRDREEFIQMIRLGRERELFDRDAHGMLEGVLNVSETQVRDVMVPRPHMVVVDPVVDLSVWLNL